MDKWLANTLHILLIAAVPVIVVLANVRMVMLPWYISVEYDKRSFPPDPHGFTNPERKHYARLALDFLRNDSGIEFLAQQTFPDGTKLYNERELRHMEDVKRVTRLVIQVWISALTVALSSAAALSWSTETRPLLRSGMMYGSAIVVGIILALSAYMLVNFNSFFTHFHAVFFETGTWVFLYSDTLIRLFPIKFWVDVATIVAAASIFEGVLLWCWSSSQLMR